MANKAIVSPVDREFFQWVSHAAFANPFSDRRYELDRQITGGRFKEEDERGPSLQRSVSERVRKLEAEGKADLRQYSEEDRELMRNVFLFETYHQFYERLDQLIDDQSKSGDAPVRVTFAPEALAALVRRGFPADEAMRFFGIFFQLRRAFFFVLHGLIGQSECMKSFRRHLWENVFTFDIRWYDRCLWNRLEDFSTLLLGETGTGKGTAAAAIGRSGFIPFDERRGCFAESFTRSFIALNLSQHPEALIESELFGHKKGAFTGAVEAHEGVFARCSPHGAIFLDEIGDVSAPIQIKLLQVLQERTFSPVGSHEKLRFRGRVIAATNQRLAALRDQKVFRDDFYYRLCSDVITVPPLRQRLQESREELALLVKHAVARMTGHPTPELVMLVLEVLTKGVGRDYPWPGNVRELEQAVRRILLTRRYEGDVDAAAPGLRGEILAGLEHGSLDADALLSGYCTLLHERHANIEEVARRTNLDRRTVKRYLAQRKSR
ncbi:MAG: sigma 54-interacting transcriptional regulator [Verrucomicrobiales bacterium]|nr:sigma 54-interacting transcriptional regulator [Verrucomicrobiales bacterium]